MSAAVSPAPEPQPAQRWWRWAAAATLMGGTAWLLPAALPQASTTGLAALLVFGGAIVAWTVLGLDETPVALVAALALLAAGATTPEAFYAGLGDDFIWLMLGAFVLAAVLRSSGLAERVTLRLVASCRTPRNLMLRLTLLIAATAFVIPSTSGRAALLLPVFLALAGAMPGPRHVQALALLFPTVILLSACASLLGAGAHLVALDMLHRLGEPVPGYLGWALLAAPFGLVTSLLACEAILRLCLAPAERAAPLTLPPAPHGTLRPAQRAVAAVTLLTVGAWATSGLHGVGAPVVALVGALLATVKPWTGTDLKSALKQVEWNLLLFMAATLVMGEALIASGAAADLSAALMGSLAPQALPGWAQLGLAALLALLSHLVVTSRTARATVLVPTVALPLAAAGPDLGLLVFLVVIGSGFCQTLTVSAKPVAVFAEHGGQAYYGARELLHLSGLLLPLMWALLMLWATVVWPAQGLG